MIRTARFDMTRRPKHSRIFAFWLLIAAIALNLVSPLAVMTHAGAQGLGTVVICSPDGLKSVDLDVEFGGAALALIDAGHCGACPIQTPCETPAHTGSASGLVYADRSAAGLGQAWADLGEDRPSLRLFAYSFHSRAPPVLG